jgi:Putative metallopeptidase domain
MSQVRALNGDEWRRLRLARMAAVEAMPYFARALFALSPVAVPGLKTAAVDRYWRLYIDPAMLGTDEGWSIALAGAVLVHEVGHVLREHGARSDAVDSPVDRMMWNVRRRRNQRRPDRGRVGAARWCRYPSWDRLPGRACRRGLLPASGAAGCAAQRPQRPRWR